MTKNIAVLGIGKNGAVLQKSSADIKDEIPIIERAFGLGNYVMADDAQTRNPS